MFKKVDSTLRGHVVVEVNAARRALGRRTAILAPSLPSQGRTVIGGVLTFREGADTDIRSLLAEPNAHIGLEQLRGGGHLPLDRVGITVIDAVTDSDLDLIAALCAAHPDLLPAGSAGLAAAFGRLAGTRRRPPLQRRSPAVLLVVGSVNPVALAQIEAVHAAALPEITIVVPVAGGAPPQVARELAARAVKALRGLPAETAIVATGGDTAMAVCRALGASALQARGEILPGAVWCTVEGADRILVTKAGGFGEPDALLRVAANLLGMGEPGG
ncbi:MAG: four-carbon acid sugar kinase family protein [Candidatus Dormibacteraceae bacterium]